MKVSKSVASDPGPLDTDAAYPRLMPAPTLSIAPPNAARPVSHVISSRVGTREVEGRSIARALLVVECGY
jgi:hypothetical protein